VPLSTSLLRLFCFAILLPTNLPVQIVLSSYNHAVLRKYLLALQAGYRRSSFELNSRMNIASLLGPVHDTPYSIVPCASSLTSQRYHYTSISLPLQPSPQQAQRVGSISLTTSSVHLPAQHNNDSTDGNPSASSSQTDAPPRHRGKHTKAACGPCRKRKTKVSYGLVSSLYLSSSVSARLYPSLSLPTSKILKLIDLYTTVRRQAPLLQILCHRSDNLQLQRRSRDDATTSGQNPAGGL
jgi:hypothetical protein